MISIIEKTRDGIALSKEEIEQLVRGIVDQSMPDYQLAAWLMAAYCKGLTDQEVFWLTDAVALSGGPIEEALGIVDKHSTGGVGDKTTLILAPLVASLGIPVLKMSGRGLGHTGGTLDKLESIPGFKIHLDKAQIERQMNEIGVAVVAQTAELAPADKRMYAVRDVTATVNNIPLIAVSIMAKKLASGSPHLVLDVKVGNGAFMESMDQARELATMMVRIGDFHDRNVRAVLTSMDQPLGYAVGNAIEVNEAQACLRNEGPEDLRDEVIALASHMVSMAKNISYESAQQQVIEALQSGSAFEHYLRWIEAQGGKREQFRDGLPLAPFHMEVLSDRAGYVTGIDTLRVGQIALDLGAGRHRLEDPVDPEVGLLFYAKIGEAISYGKPIAKVYARSQASLVKAVQALPSALTIETDQQPQKHVTILETISRDDLSK